jgi:hypothetical protein
MVAKLGVAEHVFLVQEKPMLDHNGDCEAREKGESTVKLCRDCADFVCPYTRSVHTASLECFEAKNKSETPTRACKDCADAVCKFTESNVVGKFVCFEDKPPSLDRVEKDVAVMRAEVAVLREAPKDIVRGPTTGKWAQERASIALQEAEK